jgi:hypothetical protein
MDDLVMVFMDGLLNFSMFSVVLLVLARPEHLSSSPDAGPALKRECH